MINKKIIIATGGTGGHIFPAYSLANYFTKSNYNVILTLDNRGFKYLADYKNLKLVKIPSSPLKKKNIFNLLFSIIKIIFSIFKSLAFLILNRPKIIFGMGGYSSFPICIAAKILKIDFIIYENNLIIGKANKYLLPFAKKIFVSYKELEGIPSKYSDKVYQIGNIVREEMLNMKLDNFEEEIMNKINILVLGGSQGAKVFGERLPQIFEKLKKSKIPIKIFQQCPIDQNDYLTKFYKDAQIDCKIFNFSSQIVDYYLKANLVITRSGASVLGELININKPFISIPLPSSADDHQLKNAEYYENKGFGFLIKEKDINYKLFDLIKSIYLDNSTIKKILASQRQYSDKNTFKNIKTYLEKIINEKN